MDEPLADEVHCEARRCADRAGGDRRHRLPPGGRAQPHPLDGREAEPDWLISRQRAWGSPLAMFVDKATGAPLDDAEVNARIVRLIAEAEGADAWFTRPARDFLGNRDPGNLREGRRSSSMSGSISGSTHAFVLEGARGQPLAGRSLSGRAPISTAAGSSCPRCWRPARPRGRARRSRRCMTHGFTLDEEGREDVQSRSKQQSVEPQDITRPASGAEILRLWAALVRLFGRPAHRHASSCRPPPTPTASCTQYPALSVGRAGELRAERRRSSVERNAAARALHPA